jgi:hypothetical protein
LSQIAPIVPVLPTLSVRKYRAVYNLAKDSFHGMEEVIGSIPIRSTNYFQTFSATSLPRLCRIFLASSKTAPRTDFPTAPISLAEGWDRLLGRDAHSLTFDRRMKGSGWFCTASSRIAPALALEIQHSKDRRSSQSHLHQFSSCSNLRWLILVERHARDERLQKARMKSGLSAGKTFLVPFVVALLVAPFCLHPQPQVRREPRNLAVRGLTCNSAINPLGVDDSQPRFHWRIELRTEQLRGVSQTAYQILVASSRARLDHDSGDLWDSTKTVAALASQVSYAGKTLVSDTVYYW